MKSLVIVLASVICWACLLPTSDDELSGERFSLFLLRDSTITAHGAFAQPIENLALADSAILTLRDLESYVWSTHEFTLKENAGTRYEQFLLSHGKTSGVPFVVTVGGDRIYMGTFWWGYSSLMPPACAVIEVIAPLPYRIRLATDAVDRRNDRRIYLALSASGVLVE